MAYYNDIAKQSDLVERILGTAADILNSAAERRALRRVYRTTLTELSALSGRELADLGIHPTEVKRIAWEAAYGTQAH